MGTARSIGNEINMSHAINGENLHVQGVVKAAHEELRQLIQQRAEIMKRIGTLKQTIQGLANLFGDDVLGDDLQEIMDRKTSDRQPGFTKMCRTVLMEAGHPLSAREVSQLIQERNPAIMMRHKDPLASVTTVLNRLAEYGEAQSIVRENGRRAWIWASERTEKTLATDHYENHALA
jgi:chorismate mutase